MISYEVLKKIIDEWDPVDLLCTHAPPDEYKVETNEIKEALIDEQLPFSLEKVSTIIYDIFIRAFGDDVFLKSPRDCEKVATEIINAIE